MNNNDRIKKLEKQITDLEAQVALSQSWEGDVLTFSDIQVRDKIKAFNKFYKMAHDYVRFLAQKGYPLKDGDHYIFEEVMVKCLGENVWDLIRQLES